MTIEFKTEFKEQFKNLFLKFSEYVSQVILIYEHFSASEYIPFQKSIEAELLKLLKKLPEELDTAFDQELQMTFLSIEDIEEIGSIAQTKSEYNLEKRQLKKGFKDLVELEYDDDFGENKKFKAKVEDMIRIIRPDNSLSLEVIQKELWLLDLKKEDLRDELNNSGSTVKSEVHGHDPSSNVFHDYTKPRTVRKKFFC
jgi:hypothetical protein